MGTEGRDAPNGGRVRESGDKPERRDRRPSYGDRFFHPDAAPEAIGPTTSYGDRFGDEPTAHEVLADQSRRTWPHWLTRTVALVALLTTAAGLIAWASADDPAEDVASPQPDGIERIGPPVTVVRNLPPSVAPLTVSTATGDLWRTRGFSYYLELTNPTTTEYQILDIAQALPGTEMLWDQSLVLGAGTDTALRVDFLIVNCVSVVSRPAPDALRLTLRPVGAEPGSPGAVELATLDLSTLSSAFTSAGGLRCENAEPVVIDPA